MHTYKQWRFLVIAKLTNCLPLQFVSDDIINSIIVSLLSRRRNVWLPGNSLYLSCGSCSDVMIVCGVLYFIIKWDLVLILFNLCRVASVSVCFTCLCLLSRKYVIGTCIFFLPPLSPPLSPSLPLSFHVSMCNTCLYMYAWTCVCVCVCMHSPALCVCLCLCIIVYFLSFSKDHTQL